MKNDRIQALAEAYGTPLYIFDTKALCERAEAIKSLLPAGVSFCYSVKANPFLIPALAGSLDRFEVCSPGELLICEALKKKGCDVLSDIVYSGVSRTKADCGAAIAADVHIYTAESVRQLSLLNEAAEEAGKEIPVLLRLSAGSQFGMSEEDLLWAIDHRDRFIRCRIEGIHYFVGTQRKKLERQKKELIKLADLFERIRTEHGVTLSKFEYGPGLYVPLFEGDDFSDTLAPAKELFPALAPLAEKLEVTVEMGRFLATECGTYVTKVMDVKNTGDKRYAITDGGINHVSYAGSVMGMKVPVVTHIKRGIAVDPDEFRTECAGQQEWAVCGSLCTTNDDLVRAASFTDLAPGDFLAFSNIGAYSVTESMYLFLSRTLPEILLVNGDDVKVARPFRESADINTPIDF